MGKGFRKDEGYEALYRELEKRYGPFAAQDILEHVKRADDKRAKPELEGFKVIHTEIKALRLSLRNTIRRLKVLRHEQEHWPEELEDLEARRLEQELQRLMPCYRILMRAYYGVCHKTTNVFEEPFIKRRSWNQPETLRCAA